MTDHRKVNQPSAVPTRKITAVGISGAIAAVLVWVANLLGYQLAPEHAAALAGILVFAVGYFIRSTAPAPKSRPVGRFEKGVRDLGGVIDDLDPPPR